MLDAELVAAVDAYIAVTPGTDRNAVVDEALRMWTRQRPDTEHTEWNRVRDAAAYRRFGPRR